MGMVRLKEGRDKPLRQRHPWVFSGAVESTQGDAEAGDLVIVTDHTGQYLATGYTNPHSQIRVRLLSWDPNEAINDAFWQARLRRALDGRRALALAPDTNAYRLVSAEADGMPGLVVDVYDETLVMQCQSAGAAQRRDLFRDLLYAELRPAAMIERSDVSAREKEGLPPQKEMLIGRLESFQLPILEHRRRFMVDVWDGHKTGFYLDQRPNRALFGRESWLASKTVLNVFAYTGGFAVYAATAGAARITNVDSSIPALELAERNVQLNAPGREDDDYVAGDAFAYLRHLRDKGEKFDAVILDPPKFAHSRRDVAHAARGYKDLNLQALQLIRPGGLLATFSCSGHITRDLLQKILFGAAIDAGREAQIIGQLTQGADHPILASFPESEYLKGFLCRIW